MKKIIVYTVILLTTLVATSCESWFNVTPSTQIQADEQFSSESGFKDALLGCYIGMTSETLYGKNLTWFTLDIMAQQYQLNSMSSARYIQSYSYKSTRVSPIFDAIWLKSYQVIANINNELIYLEKNKGVLNPINYSLIKGELLALRAYIHFDLMRIYGYSNLSVRTDKSSRKTIPYVVTFSKETTVQLSYSETIDLIVKDIEDAIELLKIDPITKTKPAEYYSEVNFDGFYDKREFRMNYYAAKALLARVALWEGSSANLTKALAAAEEVIEDGAAKGVYTWMTPSGSINGSAGPAQDLVLSTEHIFSLNVIKLSNIVNPFFPTDFFATDYNVLYQTPDFSNSVFEVPGAGDSDYRYLRQMPMGTEGYRIPKKLYQVDGYLFSNRVPLIRISELYCISAECLAKSSSPDLAKAIQRLQTIRTNRGIVTQLPALDAQGVLNEIYKEYRKEFISEGQLFYFYKRTGVTSIPGYTGATGDAIFMAPYPSYEVQIGRIQ